MAISSSVNIDAQQRELLQTALNEAINNATNNGNADGKVEVYKKVLSEIETMPQGVRYMSVSLFSDYTQYEETINALKNMKSAEANQKGIAELINRIDLSVLGRNAF